MIYFVEINKTHHEHEVVNGCLIEMLSTIYQGNLVYIGSEAHFVNLNFRHKTKVQCNFVRVIPPKDGNKMQWIRKFIVEIASLIRVLNVAKRQNAELVFFSSLSVVANYVLSCVKPFRFKDIRVVVTLHGELELIKKPGGQSKIERLYGDILRNALDRSPANIKYLVLGQSIKDQVLKNNILKTDQVLTIEHPYVFPDVDAASYSYQVPSFGHLGIAKRSKNSQMFFELADRFSTKVHAGGARFALIGRRWTDITLPPDSSVEYATSTEFLDRATYLNRLESIQYAVFFYDDEHYGMTGSGAIMDAIAFNKPIICLRNSYFANLFALTDVQPGWIFNTFEELCDKVSQITDGRESSTYAMQVDALKEIKEKFALPYLEKLLAGQLKDWKR